MAGFNNCCATLCGNRFCLRIRRNQNLQRATHKLEKVPNGIWSLLPVVWAFLAWLLSVSSSMMCSFATRNVRVAANAPDVEGAAVLLFQDHGVGFWGWEATDGTCYSYEINGKNPTFDTAYTVANSLTTLTDLLGGMCLVALFLGTCFPLAPLWYRLLGTSLVLVMIFDLSTLAILSSSVCQPDFFKYATSEEITRYVSKASCGLGTGTGLAIAAAMFWLFAAISVFSTNLVSMDREPKLLSGQRRGSMNDGMTELQSERQQEADRRYKEMFGDDDDDDAPAFESIRKPLSQVREEGESAEFGPDVTANTSDGDDKDSAYDRAVEEYEDEYNDEDDDDVDDKKPAPKKDNPYGDPYDDEGDFDDDEDDDDLDDSEYPASSRQQDGDDASRGSKGSAGGRDEEMRSLV
eukprot:CAMPEP_0194050636 /NCGR_PEP_ID=MMETSP0009_2-20130614/36313_1 /TAXON_ID=210454 /ORGANISM="Grammatophora oceanica, Strain CCMP 410" /LENGTH=406 /DNA_ID=CAMNT_0038697367 /DNA_START=24 /DNA_END=1244 /DNA_ORIENTATION=+